MKSEREKENHSIDTLLNNGDLIMVNVQIEEDDLLQLLLDRVEFWTDDSDTKELFRTYYSELIDSGCCYGMVLDVNQIVDNDYVNNYEIYGSIEDIMKAFNDNEEEARERIVAEYGGYYLVRTY